ncbi:MAG TPA: PepSY-like domain-containing protein [Ginsengibacter sp.]
MKKILSLLAILLALNNSTFSQGNERHEKIKVPAVVKSALYKKYADAKKVTWEKENGNYEANWGGKSGEDNSVQFKPDGDFIEIVQAIPINKLPESIIMYVNKHYKGSKITEAGNVTDAEGNTFYEVEIKGKDFIFNENGKFVKAEK